MKILLYSDVHYRDAGSFFPYNHIDSNGLTKELNNTTLGCKFIADTILSVKPDWVCGLGDLFHLTEFVTTKTLYAASQGITHIKRACNQLGIECSFMVGNHDILSEIHNINSVSGTYYFDRVITETEFKTLKDFRVAIIPYSSSSGAIYKDLVDAQNDADLILTHLDFNGCKYEGGQSSNSSLSPQLRVPCISGDIHVPQQVGSVHYIGSLVQHKFFTNTLDRIGGVIIFDTTKKTVKHIPNTYSKHYIKIRDTGQELKLPPPDKCVVQFITKRSKEEVQQILNGYEYMDIPDSFTQVEQVGTVYENFKVVEPKELLRTHISENNPDALEEYSQIFID